MITTHLEYFSVAQRAAQCMALRAIADAGWRHAKQPPSGDELAPPFAVLPRGEGCVLCGDFNSPVGAPVQVALLAGGSAPAFRNAWEIAQPAVPPAPTFGVHQRRYVEAVSCYDIFFVSEKVACNVVDVAVDVETTASDHQPVLLEMS